MGRKLRESNENERVLLAKTLMGTMGQKLRESKKESVLSVKTFAGAIRQQGTEEQTNVRGLSVKTVQGTASRTRYKVSTIQNSPFTDVDEFLFRLQMWWHELGGDGQKWLIKYLGALTDIMNVKPRDDLITALVTFWDPVHNVFCFSDFELTPTLEEIAGYSGFDGDLRNQKLIFPKAPSVHRFFSLLNVSNQIRKSNVVKGCCSFNFLYSRFEKPDGFEIYEKGLTNKQNKDTWQIHRRFAFIVAFLGIIVFPNKERTIYIRIARVVQVLTTKERHTLAPIILSDIYRALTFCKSGAKFFEGCNILLQMWLTEHLRCHPKFMHYGQSKDNFIESYEERIKDYKSPEGVEAWISHLRSLMKRPAVCATESSKTAREIPSGAR
ncbi:uncharacterized protein [Nicotiana sylvestris]|uniref:uncharacterized protein n=1 Tax=Nicotiana sylvestris TaxID=4096 RepID=UPI00388CED00